MAISHLPGSCDAVDCPQPRLEEVLRTAFELGESFTCAHAELEMNGDIVVLTNSDNQRRVLSFHVGQGLCKAILLLSTVQQLNFLMWLDV